MITVLASVSIFAASLYLALTFLAHERRRRRVERRLNWTPSTPKWRWADLD